VHKSRLAGFIIDCRTQDLPAAAEFWGAALGMKLHGLAGEEGVVVLRSNACPAEATAEQELVAGEAAPQADAGF